MITSCARPACNREAVAIFNFDGLQRVVWLSPLDESSGGSAGALCDEHADRLRPPRHWELRDSRSGELVTIPAPTPLPQREAPSTPLLARAFRAAKAG